MKTKIRFVLKLWGYGCWSVFEEFCGTSAWKRTDGIITLGDTRDKFFACYVLRDITELMDFSLINGGRRWNDCIQCINW